ncbi:unnamed protein product, partial [Prorocentrum cordatum]
MSAPAARRLSEAAGRLPLRLACMDSCRVRRSRSRTPPFCRDAVLQEASRTISEFSPEAVAVAARAVRRGGAVRPGLPAGLRGGGGRTAGGDAPARAEDDDGDKEEEEAIAKGGRRREPQGELLGAAAAARRHHSCPRHGERGDPRHRRWDAPWEPKRGEKGRREEMEMPPFFFSFLPPLW